VERKKRKYRSIDLNKLFKQNSVIDELIRVMTSDEDGSIDSMALSIFDNTDYHSRPLEMWHQFIYNTKPIAGGLPARALYIDQKDDKHFIVEWRACKVVDCFLESNELYVLFEGGDKGCKLEAIYVCFDGEDPELYSKRIYEAVQLRNRVKATTCLNVYIDCMPVDSLKALDSEQVNRVLDNAMNMNKIRQNSSLDTSSLLQQYNLNHMRTLNQLSFIQLMQSQQKDLEMVRSASTDTSLFLRPADMFPPRHHIYYIGALL
jgi:hypothetical protein